MEDKAVNVRLYMHSDEPGDSGFVQALTCQRSENRKIELGVSRRKRFAGYKVIQLDDNQAAELRDFLTYLLREGSM